MSFRAQVIAIVLVVFMLLFVLELVRRRRLRVSYSLVWLAIGIGALLLFAFPRLVSLLAWLMGIQLPSSLLFTTGIAFTFWILLHHSLTLTKLWRQDKDMAQRHALFEWQVRQLERQIPSLRPANASQLDRAHDESQEPIPQQDKEQN